MKLLIQPAYPGNQLNMVARQGVELVVVDKLFQTGILRRKKVHVVTAKDVNIAFACTD